ncbi:MAG: acyl-CoA/acyl-ACP dehydrogenase [Gammaproteobacteria bacterium]|uniref:acyl-CoA dehydrogenase family protein n=1 Tax=Pseudomaricurvus alcaniphilus TaxID=1166482 RepID=UPI0014076943|nr:acyl-CoA dehydrogenase family protein [Pseudomaricurvus alcaniphilus]MBR9911102.1 acyl-CoA/acyl-ACP dehydrogenase [Gammaproteobacteria bacterium]NHN36394.1 acyl-CoA/acyl-ACP dehydrogenase [Pseudomaricurvus alcaniphilus]
MNMILNEEQRLLKETAHGFLQSHAPVAAMRKLRDDRDTLGYSAELWRQLVELGIASIVLPEEYGGLDFGFLGLGAVLEEMGRNLTASPLFSSVVLGASALELGGSEQQRQEIFPQLVEGKLSLALAIDEQQHHQPLATAVKLQIEGDALRITGSKVFVQDGHSADKLLVVTRSSGKPGDRQGISLVLVDRETAGIEVTRTHMMDGRNAAKITFNDVEITPEQLVGPINQGMDILQPVLDRGAICMAAEMLGGIQEVFDRTIEYLKEREQFDVKIGSFQALQHRAAIMYCKIEQCRSAVLDALAALDNHSTDVSLKASQAKALVNDCYILVSNEAVQMHGGMGITDELDIGLYLKRARVSVQIMGDSLYHRDRYASLLGY